MKMPAVRARVEELQSESVALSGRDTAFTKQWIETEVVFVHRQALEKKDFSVSRSCLELVARMNGYLEPSNLNPKRHEHLHTHALDNVTLNALLSRSLADLPAAERQAIMLEAPQELRNVIEAACENVPESDTAQQVVVSAEDIEIK